MVETVRQLHREFAELIVGKAMSWWWYDGGWAQRNLAISQTAKSVPAFFMACTTTVPDTEASANQPVRGLRLPFDSFWLAYRWETDGFAESQFAFFERGADALKLALYSRGDNKDSWAGKVYNFDADTRLISGLNPVEQKSIGKAFELLDTINAPVERVESVPSLLVRQKLAKGGVAARQTRFINVYPTRQDREQTNAVGSPRSPHDRRGHWRTYRSGKRVWVRQCAIHGGATSARNYAVLKA